MTDNIPNQMHAVFLMGHGGVDKLAYKTNVPVPKITEDEVLIRVRATSVNNTDINTRIGWYSKAVTTDTNASATVDLDAGDVSDASWSGESMAFPRIQGADVCGHIVATGERVDIARIGERVLVRAMMQDPTTADRFRCWTVGSECDGGFAQYHKSKSSEVFAVDSDWSDTELASIPCAYSTAENMLHRVNLGAERILITGASGGVGIAAVQLAKRRQAEVIAQVEKTKAKSVLAAGADRIVYRDENLLKALGKNTVDVVVDVVAGRAWSSLLDVMKRGGRYITAGAIAGPIVQLDVRTLYLKDLTLKGSTYQDRICFENLIRYIEKGEIKPIIAKTFSLKEVAKAQQVFLEKKFVGKIVLVIP